jgi:chromatin segregation and condensation protein Rec8/ScpA/Scc1 (kleisin family)
MPDPTLSEVHADLVGRLEQDKRLRAVEQNQSSLEATMNAFITESVADRLEQRAERIRSEARLMTAIEATKPKSPWPAVGAIFGAVTFLFAVAAAIYTR